MMLQDPNVVILDEPTNHLDLNPSSHSTKHEHLQRHRPAYIHDHTFLQTVANRVIELTPNGIIDRLTTFDEYLLDARVRQLREEMYPKDTS